MQEEDSGQARALLELFLDDEARFAVPDLAYVEVANAFRYHRTLPSADAERFLEILVGFEFDAALVTAHLLRSASAAARSLGATVYDALYLAIAKERDGILVTADAAFERKARSRHVATLAKAHRELVG